MKQQNTINDVPSAEEAIQFHPALFLLIIVISELFSCKPKALDVQMPQADIRPVLANQYGTEGMMGLVLTKSFEAGKQIYTSDSNGIQYDSSLLLSGAEIEISGAGKSIRFEQLDAGIYGTDEAYFNDGELYTIKVICADGKRLSAQSIKMQKVNFSSLDVKETENGKSLKITYSFDDLPISETYYVVNYISGERKEQLPDKPDPEYIAKRILEQNASFDLIDKSMIKNGRYMGEKIIGKPQSSDTIAVALTHISKGYYNYLSAQKKAGTLFNQIRAEVINYPSNIQNGYGYFELNEPDFRILEWK